VQKKKRVIEEPLDLIEGSRNMIIVIIIIIITVTITW